MCQKRISERSAELLRASAARHAALAREASLGQGIDRHLFALYSIQQQREGDKPALFSDAAWVLSNQSILSTSNLSSEAMTAVANWSVVQNGYGIAYCINDDALRFGISNFKASMVGGDKAAGPKFGEVAGSEERGTNMTSAEVPTDSPQG